MVAPAGCVLQGAWGRLPPSLPPCVAAEHTPCRLPPLLFLLCRWRPLRVVGARSHYAAPKQAAVGAQEADATVAAQPKVCVWRCNAAPAAATAGKNSLPASNHRMHVPERLSSLLCRWGFRGTRSCC